MIRFLFTRGHSYTLKKVKRSRMAPRITMTHYDRILRARWLGRGTYVFTDVDRLSFWDLELAAQTFLQLKSSGVKVLNNPALVKTRYPLLRSLNEAGLNDFNVYRAAEDFSRARFPVFVRKLQGHREPLSDLLQTEEETRRVIDAAVAAGTPMENLIVVEFAAEPIRDGLYRKLSAFRIGDRIVPHISVHDHSWLVKYGQHGIGTEDLYREELELLKANPFAEQLRRVFDIAQIEYGRADFGMYRGRIQIYEINTNPHVAPPGPHPSAIRRESMRAAWDLYLDALRAIDSPGGFPVPIPNGKLQKLRAWKNLIVRTRKVP
ncbi:MAG TPA: hypothetical protein VFW05_15075 [Verrucomicrobiae bacterium]|nr:hypothetical protein [Verrucomicrobiae bacterium]